jgi:hypothetical protein
MNERIKQLALQATECYSNGQERTLDKEKFAELIVLECATVIEQNLFQGIGWNTSRAVKRHFGMEEE